MAAPSAISYSGELRADNGVLYTGQVAVTATLHDAASGDSPVWGPQDLGMIMVNQGLFDVAIGGGGAPSLDMAFMANDDLWLELTIDGVALEPRQRLRSVPFARVAANAQNVAGTPAGEIATLTDLAEHPIAAFTAEMPPANPIGGQFWHDPSDGTVYIWSNGEWTPVSAAGLDPSDLPDDGLNAVSNGTLSNQFFGVTSEWSGDPVAIPDNNASGVTVNLNVEEGAQAKLYDVTINASLALTLVSQIQIVLTPPAGTGVLPITLVDEQIAPQPGDPVPLIVNFSWNVMNTPEFVDLLGTLPAGQWSLTVSDDTLTDIDPPFETGTVSAFNVQYDVLRSDEVAMQGDLIVMGSQAVDGDLTVTGAIDAGGEVRAKHIMFKGDCSIQGDFGSGWVNYCINRTEINTASGYLSVTDQTNGILTIERKGLYNTSFYAITGGGGSSTSHDCQVLINGSGRAATRTAYNGNWVGGSLDNTFALNVGDTIQYQCERAGTFAYHSGTYWSSVEVHYLGDF